MNLRRQNCQGFSLIELMFSMAIGSIILILAATMLGSSGDGYERIGGSVATEREARAAMTQLAGDFSTAVFHKDTVFVRSGESWPVDRIGFLSLQSASAQSEAGRIGDLCAVNYYIKDLSIGGKTVRCLMRGFRESGTTVAANGTSVPGVFDALISLVSSPASSAVSDLFDPLDADEPIAFGVISFQARPKSRNSSGQLIDWVPNQLTGPVAIEMNLVLARRELGGKLKTAADWNGSGSNSSLVGDPSKPERSKNLEIYATTLRFGNDDR